MLRHERARRAGMGGLAGLSLLMLAATAQGQTTGQPASQTMAPMPAATAAAPAAAATPDTGSTVSAGTLQTKLGKEKASRIEAHIASLHSALKITAAQDPAWQNFAATMRQNVVSMDAVYAKRQAHYGSLNAVQDLQSYGEVEDANAHNVQLLIPAFQSLYDGFTPEQKKTADATFQTYTNRAVKKAN